MKITTSSGKNKIKMSKSEWQNIGGKAGWLSKKAVQNEDQLSLKDMDAPTKIKAIIRKVSQGNVNIQNGIINFLAALQGMPNLTVQNLKQILEATEQPPQTANPQVANPQTAK